MISRLLYLANAGRRREFYPTKDRILKRFGEPDGFDLQLFRCWGCEECGREEAWYGDGWRHVCGGSGTHHGFILDRYRLGSRVFHRPRDLPASWGKPRFSVPEGVMGEKNRIDGKTESACQRGLVSRRTSKVSALLLIIAFGPRENAWKLIRRPAYLMPLWKRVAHRIGWYRFTRKMPRIATCCACDGPYLAMGKVRFGCRCGACDDLSF